jgi:hypothetical protein
MIKKFDFKTSLNDGTPPHRASSSQNFTVFISLSALFPIALWDNKNADNVEILHQHTVFFNMLTNVAKV